MIRSITYDLTAAAGVEVLQDFLTAQEGRSNELVSLSFEATNDIRVRLYIDQDRIVEVGGGCDSLLEQLVPIMAPLNTGEVVKAGFINDSGSSVTIQVTLFYKENR